jgi:hypothetical protein
MDPLLRRAASPMRDDPPMTNEEVIDRAREDGFELVERTCGSKWVHGWARGDDERWPCYLEERQAIDWMRDRIRRAGVFV